MKNAVLVFALTLLVCTKSVALAGATAGNVTVSLDDGTSAQATEECAVGDLCATIHHPNGDSTEIYSEGAGACQPYHLRNVRLRNGAPLFSYAMETRHDNSSVFGGTTCGHAVPTEFVFDHGLLKMHVLPNPDGSLRVKFEIIDRPAK